MAKSPDALRDNRLTTVMRRRAIRLAYVNAALWAIGNGLVSSTLIVYLVLGRGAGNFQASWVFAAPFLAGLLRLVVPAILARLRRRKAFCLASYAASAAVLGLVPLAVVRDFLPRDASTPTTIVVAWCVYHLLEYAGTITLWSWLGDLVPRPIRGRFCGYRERWLVNGRIAGLAASVALAWLWNHWQPEAPSWRPLAFSAACGAVFMLLAVAPLAGMPGVEYLPSAAPRTPWRAVARAMFARPYRQLVLFSSCFSPVNGITAAAQGTFPWRGLGVSYPAVQGLLAMMRLGQTALAPTAGRACDRFGCRPVMIVSQLAVATGPLFLLAAAREHWWWIVGAYVAWIAYAGMNVGIDTLKLKLAPADNTLPYLTVYYALSDLSYGAATIAGGWLFDRLQDRGVAILEIYIGYFVVGWLGRTLVAALLMPLEEPGAARLRELLRALARGRPAMEERG